MGSSGWWHATTLRWGVATGVVLAAGLALALTLRTTSEVPDGASVVHAAELDRGAWIPTVREAPTVVAFADESRVVLGRGGRGRLLEQGERVRLALEVGTLEAEVVSRPERPFVVEVGPFRVEVIGTVFSVQWEPEAGVVEVGVERGLVRVTGGPLGAQGVLLAPGDEVTANLRAATSRVSRGGDSDAIGPSDPRDESGEASGEGASEARSDSPAEGEGGEAGERGEAVGLPVDPTPGRGGTKRERTEARARPVPSDRRSWSEFAAEGQHELALREAESAGFDRLLSELGVLDLARLADSARYARDIPRAKQALRALRERFPATSPGRRAAFLLGRLAAELARDPGEAVHWFGRYLAEDPEGPMVEDARGRLMHALVALGDRPGALRVAAEIVARDGRGRHAQAARKLLGAPSPVAGGSP